jgi:hypothetical protein
VSKTTASNLEEALRQSGEGWVIDWFSPKDQALDYLRKTFEDINEAAKLRGLESTVKISEQGLVAEYNRNPPRIKAFFQALAGIRTAEMLLMVWRIMQGMLIKKVNIDYTMDSHFFISVTLESPYGEEDAPYESTQINDGVLLRHFGIIEINSLPRYDGFYAIRRA